MEKALATKHILLIDDDPISNMINTKIIKINFSFLVDAYTDAQEALDQFSAWLSTSPDQFPDIIFLDINMPIMDGWEFLEEFEKFPAIFRKKCNVYLLTSSIDAEDIEKSTTYKSVKEFISKPLTLDKLRMLAGENEVSHL